MTEHDTECGHNPKQFKEIVSPRLGDDVESPYWECQKCGNIEQGGW